MSETQPSEPNASTAAGQPSAGASPAEGATAEPAVKKPLPPPNYVFLGAVAVVILAADLLSKWWAETTLLARPSSEPNIVLIEDVLTFSLAYNKGGAFGMLAGEQGFWRQPFFVAVSIAAVVFIVSLYKKLLPEQKTLRWGLPLVLGGALGNLADRIFRGKVVDFIDYRAGWVETMNELIHKLNSDWHVTSHWPTFNVADMAICTGIGLMALDMFLHPNAGKSDADTQGGGKPEDSNQGAKFTSAKLSNASSSSEGADGKGTADAPRASA